MDLDQALQTFIIEGRELLADMETALLRAASEVDPLESVNAIFRGAHTIKGSAGLFGLDGIVSFTHIVESLLDDVRAGITALDETLVELLLSCADHIGELIDAVDADTCPDKEAIERGDQLLACMDHYLTIQQRPTPTCDVSKGAGSVGGEAKLTSRMRESHGAGHWHISLRFGRTVLKNGMDPLSFFRYLATLGSIEHIVAIPDAIPSLTHLDAESCYLGFELAFKSDADQSTIENVFEFVRDDCALQLVPPKSEIGRYVDLIEQLPEEPARLGDIFVQCGSITAQELESALLTRMRARSTQLIDGAMAEHGVVDTERTGLALTKQKRPTEHKSQEAQSVRVDAHKLDRLIDLVGELITATASTTLAARRSHNAELHECSSTLAELVEQVRDSALQLRMVKISATFDRFKRVVHDVARELRKDIQLQTSGEDTELDKMVVEKIGDPLLHLVRNAMDHGIDGPEARRARGKPARGTVFLNAYHDSGSIVIEVGDDGEGLNREKILAKAIERGVIESGATLSDTEIDALIFEPGFSTADQVTNLSGRGVGMDVVKRNITALRGTVVISSRPESGTTVTVRLPLTLAMIDGFQIGVGRSVFVVPLDMVDECVKYSADTNCEYTDLRGQILPFVRLRKLFEVQDEGGSRQNIVVVKHAGKKFGLVVDSLMGEVQTVIKPLSKMFAHVKGISGSSITGSGEVALILDIPALMEQAQRRAELSHTV